MLGMKCRGGRLPLLERASIGEKGSRLTLAKDAGLNLVKLSSGCNAVRRDKA